MRLKLAALIGALVVALAALTIVAGLSTRESGPVSISPARAAPRVELRGDRASQLDARPKSVERALPEDGESPVSAPERADVAQRDVGLTTLDMMLEKLASYGTPEANAMLGAEESLDNILSGTAAAEYWEWPKHKVDLLRARDAQLLERVRRAHYDSQLARCRAARRRVLAGHFEDFETPERVRESTHRVEQILARYEGDPGDRTYIGLPGSRPGTSRVVQFYRHEDPRVFSTMEDFARAREERRSAIRALAIELARN